MERWRKDLRGRREAMPTCIQHLRYHQHKHPHPHRRRNRHYRHKRYRKRWCHRYRLGLSLDGNGQGTISILIEGARAGRGGRRGDTLTALILQNLNSVQGRDQRLVSIEDVVDRGVDVEKMTIEEMTVVKEVIAVVIVTETEEIALAVTARTAVRVTGRADTGIARFDYGRGRREGSQRSIFRGKRKGGIVGEGRKRRRSERKECRSGREGRRGGWTIGTSEADIPFLVPKM